MITSAALEPALPALMKPLVDGGLIAQDPVSILQIPVLIVVAFTIKGLADYITTLVSQAISQKIIATFRSELFSKQLDMPIPSHSQELGGRMTSRITYDTMMIGDAVSTAWIIIVRDCFVLLGLLAFLLYTAWSLTILVLITGPLLAFVINNINLRLRKASRTVQDSMGKLTGKIEESVLGLKEIKIFSAHDFIKENFNRINEVLCAENIRISRFQALNAPLVQVVAALSIASVVYAASLLNQNNQLTPGDFVAFVTAMAMIFEPIRRLMNVNSTVQKGLVAAESIFSTLDGETDYKNSVSRRAESICTDSGSCAAIQFDSISFRYPSAPTWVFKDYSMSIKKGEKIVIVAPSGAGKTTLLSLICGFDLPETGSVKIFGLPTAERANYRSHLALVSQDTHLFDCTIMENIKLGRSDASDEDVYSAARRANAWNFIKHLPQGIHTPLGTLGSRLSGGQRQRIALARAYLKDAPIILLDEGTNAQDKESERSILEALIVEGAGKTVIVVTHNMNKYLSEFRLLELPRRL